MAGGAPDLRNLAAALRSCQPDDPEGVQRLGQQLQDAAAACSDGDAAEAEALLTCVTESFASAGEQGKELLDQLLLDVLPALAPLASRSDRCAQCLCAFCGLAAAAAAPRDVITASLEVLDQLTAGDESSLGPSTLQFLTDLLALLPRQLSQLRRRTAAFALECLPAAGKLVQVHGLVLRSWMMAQLLGSERSTLPEVLRRVDTFLAANWQVYLDFVDELLSKALPHETDAAARQSVLQAASGLICHMLLHLTDAWQPAQLSGVAAQLLCTQPSAPLPSAESVLAPTALLAARGQPAQQAAAVEADAAAVVHGFLRLLHECGAASWASLAGSTRDTDAAGAALAVLYSSWQDGSGTGRPSLQPPGTAIETVQVACRLCYALSQASDGNALVLLKAIALLQVATQHATALQDSAADTDAGTADAAGVAKQLLPELEPCITMLASTVAQAAAAQLRSQATLVLHQLVAVLPVAVRQSCLQQLLDGKEQRMHPEVAALLLQQLRLQLANAPPGGTQQHFSAPSCVQLALPWLQQHSAVGWKQPDQLADQANAVCAALAVVRLALLKRQRLAAAGDGGSGSGSSSSGSLAAGLHTELRGALQALSAAVAEALPPLAASADAEAGAGSSAAALPATVTAEQQQQQQQQVVVAGEATGSGRPVDAWLAVSRVQDVLDRVVELL